MAQYYINSASTGSGDGTTQAITGANAAWAAISEIGGLAAGDIISFNKGNTWREQLAPATTGTAGNVVTYNAYGTGADPIINGASLETTWTATGGTDLSGDANLLALWYMEDATGATRLDETAGNHDLTDSNTVVQHATHVQGTYAAAFTATSSMQLSIADASLAATWPHSNGASDTDYTMGGWFRVNNVAADHVLMSKGWGLNLYVDSAESYKPRLKILDHVGGVDYVLANAAITANAWTHIVVAIDLTAETATMYIDGVAQTDVLSIADLREVADAFWIGNSVDKAYLDGYADECFMFDRALSGAEILAIKNDFVDGSGGGVTNVFEKTFTNIPTVVIEDGTLLTYVDWDTDLATTGAAMSAGTFSVDTTNKIAYVWCTDDADPDTHTMEVSAETGAARHVILCRDASYITFDGLDVRQGTKANIHIDQSGGIDVSDIIVQNCTSSYAGRNGIHVENWANEDGANPIIDCTIDNNTVLYCGGHGIKLDYDCHTITASDNTVHHNGWAGIDVATGGHGISLWGSDTTAKPSDCIIESNTVYNTYVETGGTEGTGIQCDDNTLDCIVRYNLIYDNEGTGLIANVALGCSFYYNIVFDNALGGFRAWEADSGTMSLYNNVFYSNDVRGVWFESTNTSTILFKNNILSENSGSELEVVSGAHTNFTGDNNCIYHSGGGTFMDWAGTDYNWADWLTNSSQDANSVNSDPLMTDPANDDFTLQLTSPCINTGVDVSLTADYAGAVVTAPPNIGAYETVLPIMGSAFFMSMGMGMT